MKRVMDVLWPIIGLGTVAFTSWLLFQGVAGPVDRRRRHGDRRDFADVVGRSRSARPRLAYSALAWYDQIALAHLGRRLSWRFVGLVSFTTYALAHNIGATVLSGAVVRYRAYSTKGLGVAEVGVLVAFCSFTFTLGNVLLGGLTLLFHPDLARRYVRDARLGGTSARRRAARRTVPLYDRIAAAFRAAARSAASNWSIRARRSRRGNCSPGRWS